MKRILVFAFLVAVLAGAWLYPSDAAVTVASDRLTTYIPEWCVYEITITFDASYDSLGETVSLGAYLPNIKAAWGPSTTTSGKYFVVIEDSTWSSGTCELSLFSMTTADTLQEVVNTTDVSAQTFKFFIAGPK